MWDTCSRSRAAHAQLNPRGHVTLYSMPDNGSDLTNTGFDSIVYNSIYSQIDSNCSQCNIMDYSPYQK